MTNLHKHKRQKRTLRHNRVRSQVKGTESRPRLAVFRSANNISAQIIDDQKHHTLISVNSIKLKSKAGNIAQAQEVGKEIAKQAKDQGIGKVVFDRGGYLYHGRVKALAEAAREGGLEF